MCLWQPRAKRVSGACPLHWPLQKSGATGTQRLRLHPASGLTFSSCRRTRSASAWPGPVTSLPTLQRPFLLPFWQLPRLPPPPAGPLPAASCCVWPGAGPLGPPPALSPASQAQVWTLGHIFLFLIAFPCQSSMVSERVTQPPCCDPKCQPVDADTARIARGTVSSKDGSSGSLCREAGLSERPARGARSLGLGAGPQEEPAGRTWSKKKPRRGP